MTLAKAAVSFRKGGGDSRFWSLPTPLTFRTHRGDQGRGVVWSDDLDKMLALVGLGSPGGLRGGGACGRSSWSTEGRKCDCHVTFSKTNVFALKVDQLVLNVMAGPDGLTPLKRAVSPTRRPSVRGSRHLRGGGEAPARLEV